MQSRFPNLYLAIEACRVGQSATTRLNAANEVAVAAFLDRQIRFSDIARINEQTLNKMEPIDVSSLQQILEQDQLARHTAAELIRGLM